MVTIQNYINGKLQAPIAQIYLNNINPAKGEAFGKLPDSNSEDVELAVLAAKKAFPAWSNLSVAERVVYIERIADLIEQNLERFVQAESLDSGKPIWLARKVDIPRSVSNLRYFSAAITHFSSESHFMENHGINYTLRQPIGVVGCISPWNLPLYLFTWKIAPALVTGNTVVAKPSEITPYTAYLFSEICKEAGLPDGVLNIVHGTGQNVGAAMVAHPEVKAISFTGGTNTGQEIARVAAPMLKKLSLELGGKNPTIIFEDANFEDAVNTAVRSAFTNQGQICLCGSRILVHQSIYEKFKTAFVEKVKQIKVGNPSDEENFMGAIVSKAHFNKILSCIALAVSEGGKILTGGKALSVKDFEQGFFIEPTVIEGLPYSSRTNMEEIFGPVVTLIPFQNDEEALEIANYSTYGLAANIWTNDLKRAHYFSEKLETGIVWVNCWMVRDLRTPFGGQKFSGLGREGGNDALRFFTEPKNVLIHYK